MLECFEFNFFGRRKKKEVNWREASQCKKKGGGGKFVFLRFSRTNLPFHLH
jgi:hypothetical protein